MDEAMMRWLMQQIGYQPTVDPTLSGFQIPGDMNSRGEPLPTDIDVVRDQMNYLQDTLQTFSDPAFLAAYGGSYAGYRPEDFNPVTTREEVQRPGADRLNQYLQAPPGSLENFIANRIQEGMQPTEIYNAINNAVMDPSNEVNAAIAAMVPLTPPSGDGLSDPVPDLGRVWSLTSDLESSLAGDPSYSQEEVGPDGRTRYYTTTETPSDAQMEFDKQGLPNPFIQYGAESFRDPNLLAQEQQAMQESDALTSRAEEIRQQLAAMGQTVDPNAMPRPALNGLMGAQVPNSQLPQASTGGSDRPSGDAGLLAAVGKGIIGGVFGGPKISGSMAPRETMSAPRAMNSQANSLRSQLSEAESAAYQKRLAPKMNQGQAIDRVYARQYEQAFNQAGRTPYTDARQARMMMMRQILGG